MPLRPGYYKIFLVESLFFTDRPFRIGDRVKWINFDRFVEDIGIRSTRLRTLEKRLVTIPNYKIVDTSIEKY